MYSVAVTCQRLAVLTANFNYFKAYAFKTVYDFVLAVNILQMRLVLTNVFFALTDEEGKFHFNAFAVASVKPHIGDFVGVFAEQIVADYFL